MTPDSNYQDKFEIEQVLFRYARGVDRRDWDLVRSVYHPDATEDHAGYKGGKDGYLEQLIKRHHNIDQSLHLISNVMVDMIDSGTAVVESYVICYQRYISADKAERQIASVREGETVLLMVAARYIDRFERRNQTWRIAKRIVAFDVVKFEPTPLGGGLDPTALIPSRRDKDDALWIEHRRMGP